MTGLAAYAVHEAEMEIARATAVRALMQTGATHDQAAAAVREHIRTPDARRALADARSEDSLDALLAAARPVFVAVGEAFAKITDTFQRAARENDARRRRRQHYGLVR